MNKINKFVRTKMRLEENLSNLSDSVRNVKFVRFVNFHVDASKKNNDKSVSVKRHRRGLRIRRRLIRIWFVTPRLQVTEARSHVGASMIGHHGFFLPRVTGAFVRITSSYLRQVIDLFQQIIFNLLQTLDVVGRRLLGIL